MAITCLSYLSAPWFSGDQREETVEKYIKGGQFSFQDYALQKWGHHLEVFICAGPDLLTGVPGATNYQVKLSRALAKFVEVYGEDLSLPEDEKQVTDARGKCQAFCDCQYYNHLVLVWTHLYGHHKSDPKQRNKVIIKSLDKALKSNRERLEALVTDQDGAAELVEELRRLYGDYMFKCDRLTCDFFYEGFEDKASQEAHLKRHDRPFRCPVEGCAETVFGFSTNKDKEKHISTYHPDETSTSGFISTPCELLEDANFRCEVCSRNFTRKANRDAHVRSHYGERPFECPSCDRAFTRSNDLRRHERHRHVRRRG